MRWEQAREDGVTVHRSTEGHQVWKDHEWLDRAGNERDGYHGPMRKREGFRLRHPDGREEGLFPTLRGAKAVAARRSPSSR